MSTDAILSDDKSPAENPAADLIRQKLKQLYAGEPDAKEELRESKATAHRSAHQEFMYQLSKSGRSLAEIQTAWHSYYIELPDSEKHQVWQEFYTEHSKRGGHATSQSISGHTFLEPALATAPKESIAHDKPKKDTPEQDPRSISDIKKQLVSHISKRSSRKKSSHYKSILFGLSSGAVVMVILLFSFFNERFLAPFITPSRAVSATPIIIDPGSTAVGPEPKIIIPKINVEIPVVYTEPSIEEEKVQKALESGVVHYATTPNPGELGNGVIFGHSSNNILNKGDYKFAFVLLKRLENGDTFMLQKDGKRFVYKVFSKKVVKPEDVSVLTDGQGKPATFSLITCDPPGTSLNRLVVTGEQISPDPATNTASSVAPTAAQPATIPQTLPSDSDTLWERFTNWLTS